MNNPTPNQCESAAMPKPYNGADDPAFPGFLCTSGYGASKRNAQGEFEEYSSGMTLRDYFACQALAGILASDTPEFRNPDAITTAKSAYDLADAMLEARRTP